MTPKQLATELRRLMAEGDDIDLLEFIDDHLEAICVALHAIEDAENVLKPVVEAK